MSYIGVDDPEFEAEVMRRIEKDSISKDKRICKLQAAVHDLLATDKPPAWRLHLGESRYEEIKALEQTR